jgi:hypothetical protein
MQSALTNRWTEAAARKLTLVLFAAMQMLLPLLECKLPSELTCLEQVLLLQARHKQPAIPPVHQPQDPTAPPAAGTPAAAGATGTAAVSAEYDTQKQRLLQHWYAPHRYRLLNCLERLLLAALDGRDALLRLSTDLLHQLQSSAEKRGVKRSWWVFVLSCQHQAQGLAIAVPVCGCKTLLWQERHSDSLHVGS